MAASVRNRLAYKDLSNIFPAFDELRDVGFSPSAFKDGLVLRDDPFPKMPADIYRLFSLTQHRRWRPNSPDWAFQASVPLFRGSIESSGCNINVILWK